MDSDTAESCGRSPAETAHDERLASTHESEQHLALVYESVDEQLSAIIPFVRQGLDRGERVVYIVNEQTKPALHDVFAAAGIDVDTALESGALTLLSTDETYACDGSFDTGAMLDYLDATLTETVIDGRFDRLRVTGEMTWALEKDTDTLDALVEYERQLNEFLPTKPVLGLCQYNRERFPSDLLYEIIRAHPHQVYDATVCQNFAYLPQDAFFETGTPPVDPVTFIDTHLDRVRARGQLQKHEQNIGTLAAASQDLLDGDREAIFEQTLSTLQQALDPVLVGIFGYDEGEDDLKPEAVGLAPDHENPTDVSLPDWYRDLLWETFVTDASNVFTNVQSEAALPELGAVLQSGIVTPIDQYGVLFVASTRASAFDEADAQLLATISTTVESALDRIDREQTLSKQNDQLRRLARLNRTIRSLHQALIRASTREEIEQVVCDQLTDSDRYRFAWIGDRDTLGEGVIVREWAGQGSQYLDEISRDPEQETTGIVNGPARTVIETGEVQAVSNALTETMFGAWRTAALDAGFHSCLSLPLQHEATEYGVLSLYATEAQTFTGMEREVLAELAATVAYAIDAVETKAGINADRRSELTLRITEESDWIRRLASEVECRVTVETALPDGDDRVRLFLSVTDATPDAVRTFAEQSVAIESVRTITEDDGGGLFEVVASGQTPLTALDQYPAEILRFTADEAAASLTVAVPRTVNPREFVEDLSAIYPSLDVESIRRVNEPTETRQSFFATIEDRLTDKQLQALELAYHSGYFSQPRDSSAAEIADSLGIAQSTLSGHLRLGQQKLFEALFDSKP